MMTNKLSPLSINSELYTIVNQLWIEAFPENERRNTVLQKKMLAEDARFCAYILQHTDSSQEVLGAVYLWQFPEFVFIEHLVTAPQLRNRGFGARMITLLKERYHTPFVLEAERPTTALSKRRIEFYQRNGFQICSKEYLQPPYHKEGEPIPMYLLTTDVNYTSDKYEEIVALLYKEVYQISTE